MSNKKFIDKNKAVIMKLSHRAPAVFSAIPYVRPEPDHDYKIEEMTEEQKEVFLTLNDEAE